MVVYVSKVIFQQVFLFFGKCASIFIILRVLTCNPTSILIDLITFVRRLFIATGKISLKVINLLQIITCLYFHFNCQC